MEVLKGQISINSSSKQVRRTEKKKKVTAVLLTRIFKPHTDGTVTGEWKTHQNDEGFQTYNDDQKSSYADYIELSMQSQFNKRGL